MSYKKVKLGDLFASSSLSINPKNFSNETFQLYSVPAFNNKTPDIVYGRKIGSSKQIVKPNDVLLCKIVPHIRRSWVVGESKEYRMIASGEWIVFRSDLFYPDYLKYFLVSDFFHPHLMKTVSGVGGSLMRARPSDLSKIQIPLPPFEEQKRIASILDKADDLRQKRQHAIEKLDDLVQSVFLDMFGDPVTNEKQLPSTSIRTLLSFINYGSSKKAGSEGKWAMLRMNNITYSGGLNFSDLKYVDLTEKEEKKYLAYKGDILFNRTNSKELVGKTAVFLLDEPMVFAGYLIRARVNDKAIPEYISAYLNSKHGKLTLSHKCKSIIGMANINAQEFQNINILLPSIEDQKRFRVVTQKIRSFREKLLTELNKLDTLFSSLQQRAFKGEL